MHFSWSRHRQMEVFKNTIIRFLLIGSKGNHDRLWFIDKKTFAHCSPVQTIRLRTNILAPLVDERLRCRDKCFESLTWQPTRTRAPGCIYARNGIELLRYSSSSSSSHERLVLRWHSQHDANLPLRCFRRSTGFRLRFQCSTLFIPSKNTLMYTSWPPYGVCNNWNWLAPRDGETQSSFFYHMSSIVVKEKTWRQLFCSNSVRMVKFRASFFTIND